MAPACIAKRKSTRSGWPQCLGRLTASSARRQPTATSSRRQRTSTVCWLTPPRCSPQTMPAQESCAECERLWEEYTQAATAHVKIVARRHKAALQNDSAVLDEIAAIEADLAQQQIKARRAIDDHE